MSSAFLHLRARYLRISPSSRAFIYFLHQHVRFRGIKHRVTTLHGQTARGPFGDKNSCRVPVSPINKAPGLVSSDKLHGRQLQDVFFGHLRVCNSSRSLFRSLRSGSPESVKRRSSSSRSDAGPTRPAPAREKRLDKNPSRPWDTCSGACLQTSPSYRTA